VSEEQHDALQRLERGSRYWSRWCGDWSRPAPPPSASPRPPHPSPFTQPSARAGTAPILATAHRGPDLEQWFGQRGLLIVGVLALLTAAGFFLKYAIDRGWIAPVVRSLLAIVAGVGLAAWGETRIRGGLRRYGAAMIGAGGGLAYLGLWRRPGRTACSSIASA